MSEIKPKIENGVALCKVGCPSLEGASPSWSCQADGFRPAQPGAVCKPWWYREAADRSREAYDINCTARTYLMPCECTQCRLERAEAEIKEINASRKAFHMGGGLGWCPTCSAPGHSTDFEPIRDAIKCIEELQDQVKVLEAECSKLSAGTCPEEGGLVGDEYGNFYCELKESLRALRADRLVDEVSLEDRLRDDEDEEEL